MGITCKFSHQGKNPLATMRDNSIDIVMKVLDFVCNSRNVRFETIVLSLGHNSVPTLRPVH